MKPKYSTSLSFDDKIKKKIETIKKHKYTIIQAFEMGLDKVLSQIEQGERYGKGNRVSRRD